jgi:hypothetical protein
LKFGAGKKQRKGGLTARGSFDGEQGFFTGDWSKGLLGEVYGVVARGLATCQEVHKLNPP